MTATTRLRRRLESRRERSQRGMTLIEIMLVLAILAVVMGILFGPSLLSMFSSSKESATKVLVTKYADQAFTQWTLNNDGGCPASLEEVGKYIGRKDATDTYKTPMIMLCGEEAPEGHIFGVRSAGPDKKMNTPDDITSWESMDERKTRMGKQ